jgi:rhodanese-related sulfurtransferase
MDSIDVAGLKQHRDAGSSLFLLDVREPWEFELCHIAGSVNIPMSRIVNSLDELDRTAMTVVICHHGNRSYHVGHYLENNGFERIINLEGGVNAWAEQIEPEMARY